MADLSSMSDAELDAAIAAKQGSPALAKMSDAELNAAISRKQPGSRQPEPSDVSYVDESTGKPMDKSGKPLNMDEANPVANNVLGGGIVAAAAAPLMPELMGVPYLGKALQAAGGIIGSSAVGTGLNYVAEDWPPALKEQAHNLALALTFGQVGKH